MADLRVALRRGEPWSVSGLLFGLDGQHDDEGRPLGERRAPSHAKSGVEIELRTCPYRDERSGHPMNVSALAQITAHLDEVYAEIAAFRASRSGSSGWHALLVSVVDLLLGPVREVLAPERRGQPITARAAVGHKLAAGYFGVARDLVREAARGIERPVTVAALLDHVATSRALIGASEACAGPPHMIARTTEVLLTATSDQRVPEARVALAELLTTQILIGIAWELFDRALEHTLLVRDLPPEARAPRTTTIRQAIDARTEELTAQPAPRAQEDLAAAASLAAAAGHPWIIPPGQPLEAPAGPIPEELIDRFEALILHGDGAVIIADPARRRRVARRMAEFALTYQRCVTALFRLEERLRPLVDAGPVDAVALTSLVFPHPRAQRWLEALSGHRHECEPARSSAVVLSNHHRRETVLTGATP